MSVIVKVPLFEDVYTNTAGAILNDKNYRLYDAIQGELGETISRPGLGGKISLGTANYKPTTGVWYWLHKDKFLITNNTKVYLGTPTGGTVTIADKTGTAITTGRPTSFTTDGAVAIIASGGNMVYTDGSANTATLAPAGAPTAVTHVDFLDGYIIANSLGSNTFHWCDTNDYTNWSTGNSGSAQAVANADNIVALKVLNGEIFLFGQITTERWENVSDGIAIFQRIAGSTLNYGCSAPYSVVASEDALVWLDHRRRFVMWRNNEFSILSTPYDKEVNDFSSVSDCVGTTISVAGRQLMVFSFISEARTLMFDYVQNKWGEWRNWDSGISTYWLGYTYAYSTVSGIHLIGSSINNDIFILSSDTYTDDSQPIRGQRITGHINYGAPGRKRSNWMTIRVQRGVHTLDRNASLMFRWNDDNKGWSNEIIIDLGAAGETWDLVQKLYPKGIFRTRQYELSWSDPILVTFAEAYENIEVLNDY